VTHGERRSSRRIDWCYDDRSSACSLSGDEGLGCTRIDSPDPVEIASDPVAGVEVANPGKASIAQTKAIGNAMLCLEIELLMTQE
jgi:hypothetical protein